MAKHRDEDQIIIFQHSNYFSASSGYVAYNELTGIFMRLYWKQIPLLDGTPGPVVVQAADIRPTPITAGRHSKEHIERGGYKKISLTLHLSPGPPVITLDQ